MKDMITKADGRLSKTMTTAVLIAVLGVVEQNFQMLQPLLQQYYGLAFIVFAALMAGLRIVTTSPLRGKQ